MEYRKATKDDIGIVMELREEMLREVNGLSEDHVFTETLIRNSRQYFLNGDQTTCIAFDNKTAAACASISYIEVMPTFSHPTGKRAYIMNVYTRSPYRRQGIARELLKILTEEARARNVTEISLNATDSGKPLYEAIGFRTSDEYMTMVIN